MLAFQVAFSISTQAYASEPTCSNALFATDFDGMVVTGDKADLIRAAEQGQSLRVGWGLDFNQDSHSDLIHWSDAVFVTVFENDVFTQVQSIHRQSPQSGKSQIVFPDEAQTWSGIISSDGWLQGRMNPGTVGPRRQVSTVWCELGAPETKTPVWNIAYRSGINGEALSGSIQPLLDAVRAGHPIRVGWGLSREQDGITRSVEHVINPVFLTVIDGQHVTAQLPEHISQQSYWQAENSLFADGQVMWRGLISTTGTFDAIWVDRASGDTVRRSPQRAVFTWYIQSTAKMGTPTLAIPNGVTSDDNRIHHRFPNPKP